MSELHAVIMAGGSGTRFWPASRRQRPKQLLPLAHGQSLLAATVERLQGVVSPTNVWVVTNQEQVEGVREALPEVASDRILVEPESRDTAPCIALAVACVEAASPGAIMAFMPADHLIEPRARFAELLERAASIATNGESLVTFGIRPTFAATGYGYIEPGEPLDQDQPRAFRVRSFREKPDAQTAERFLATGRMLWNSGIFVWTAATIRAAMEQGSSELASCTTAMLEARQSGDVDGLVRAFRSTPKTSIDYAVMEHARDIVVVEADVTWHDLGSFLALGSVAPSDADGNVHQLSGGSSDVLLESRDCIVYAEGPRTVALLGVSDLVVVLLDDVVMVCPTQRAEELRTLRAEVERRGRSDLL